MSPATPNGQPSTPPTEAVTPDAPVAGSVPLTNKRYEVLCIEYVKDLCRNAACRRVGYSTAHGKELWRRPEILARIAYLVAEREEQSRLKAFRVLDELAALVLSRVDNYEVDDYGNVTPKADAPDNAMAAIASIKRRPIDTLWPQGPTLDGKPLPPVILYETEIRLWDKNPALTNAMRHMGLVRDQQPLPPGVSVTVNNRIDAAVELTPREREDRLAALGFMRAALPPAKPSQN